ncbi:hypothetical protein diail_4324 [Diaporthe ilicicola]|nr:hypothetical protein diail_4324 [Diaporthe ilicicola]
MAVGADASKSGIVSLKDRAAWRSALASPRPVLAHLNADTTWLLQLPVPASANTSPRSKTKTKKTARRSRFNILIDPWLRGPQSDVAAWFSTQWHVIEPTVQTIQELDEVLEEVGDEKASAGGSQIDCVAISHEFTDHCHQATLTELPKGVPVVATEKAADLIRSWGHFDTVITTPGFSSSTPDWHDVLVDKTETLPPWLGIGRVITQGNALYYHSAVIIAFDLGYSPDQRATRSRGTAPQQQSEAVIYSPHGIKGPDLECVRAAGIRTLALLHGLDDIRIWMTAQLNLGALNGVQAARVSGAKYWVATHDEAKRGGGFISWLLQRTTYSLRDAVEAEEAKAQDGEGKRLETPSYEFVELGSGDGLVLT